MRAAALASLLLISYTASAGAPEPACKDRYDLEAKFLANPDESVLIAGVIGWCRKNKLQMLWDERYAAVAREWSGYLIKAGPDSSKMLPVDRLRFELLKRGVTDAAITPFSVEGPPEKMPPEMLQFLDEEKARGRYTHFAVGVTRFPDQKKMVSTLLLGKRPALLDPLPVCPPPGSRLKLRMQLLRGYRHARWLLTTPKGEVKDDTLIYQEGAWSGTVPLDSGKGTYQMEIVVQGSSGPEVAALFPLYVGVERPAIPTVKLHPAPQRYKKPEDAENAMLKLALNGVYGDSNSEHSVFYDPQFTMSITLNGQLLLCLLAEALFEIEGIQLVQVNTDGLTVRVRRSDVLRVERVKADWQMRTKLQLEQALYKAMFVRDVNNYIGLFSDGTTKRKGAYEWKADWHQNAGALVVPKVAEKVLVENAPIRETVENWPDRMDFMLRTKVPRSSYLQWGAGRVQNVTRYYIAKGGQPLTKWMPPLKGKTEWRKIGVESGWNVQVCNDIADGTLPIDYDYYVERVEKLCLGLA